MRILRKKDVGKGENVGDLYFLLSPPIFLAFVEKNATMSSMRYFENHVSYFVQKRRKETLFNLISLRQISVSIALEL